MFGDSIYEFLLILGLILIAVDFFVASDVLSLIAYVVLSYLVVHAADLPLMYSILLGIGVWFVIVALHYTLFRKLISKFCNKVVAPTVIEEDPLTRYVGHETAVVTVDGKNLLRIEGDLVAFQDSEKYEEGDLLRVTSFDEGNLQVETK